MARESSLNAPATAAAPATPAATPAALVAGLLEDVGLRGGVAGRVGLAGRAAGRLGVTGLDGLLAFGADVDFLGLDVDLLAFDANVGFLGADVGLLAFDVGFLGADVDLLAEDDAGFLAVGLFLLAVGFFFDGFEDIDDFFGDFFFSTAYRIPIHITEIQDFTYF